MTPKKRIDYVRHYLRSLYDPSIEGCVDPYSLLTDNFNSYDLIFPYIRDKDGYFINTKCGDYIFKYNGNIFSTEGTQILDISGCNIGETHKISNPKSLLDLGYFERILPGIVNVNNTVNDLDMYYNSNDDFYIITEHKANITLTLDKIPITEYDKQSQYYHTKDELNNVLLHLRYFRDVYDKDKISNIVSFNNRVYNKDEFWNEFKDYLVPVCNDVKILSTRIYNDREIGTYIPWYINGACTVFPMFVEIVNPDNIFTTEIYGMDTNTTVPVLKDMRVDKIPMTTNGIISLYNNGERFNGCFDFSTSFFGLTDYWYLNYYNDRFRYATLSNIPFNYQDYEKKFYIGFESPPPEYENNLLYFIGPPLSFSGEAGLNNLYTPGTQLSKQINSNYGKYGLSDISTYYEDLDVLDRSFTFDYADENERLAIICYNQRELENYLNVWGINFSYYNYWVEPLPYLYEVQKVRHILPNTHSVITAEKVRHKLNTNSPITAEKVRHIIGGGI